MSTAEIEAQAQAERTTREQLCFVDATCPSVFSPAHAIDSAETIRSALAAFTQRHVEHSNTVRVRERHDGCKRRSVITGRELIEAPLAAVVIADFVLEAGARKRIFVVLAHVLPFSP